MGAGYKTQASNTTLNLVEFIIRNHALNFVLD